MEPHNKLYPMLVKITLPLSFYVHQLMRRAHQLKHYFPNLFIQPPLNQEERNRARMEGWRVLAIYRLALLLQPMLTFKVPSNAQVAIPPTNVPFCSEPNPLLVIFYD